MANMNIEKITIACSNFRYALEKCHSLLGRSFENFPSGACGDTTPLLGTYLIEQGFETFMYASGNKGNTTHAWLQLNSIVIDITADQFPEISEKVIVSENSAWHKTFRGQLRHVADYRIYEPRPKSLFEKQYKIITEHLNCLEYHA